MISVPITVLLGACVAVSVLRGKGSSARLAILIATILGVYLGPTSLGGSIRATITSVIGVTVAAVRAAIGG